jgi:hypothetical protein
MTRGADGFYVEACVRQSHREASGGGPSRGSGDKNGWFQLSLVLDFNPSAPQYQPGFGALTAKIFTVRAYEPSGAERLHSPQGAIYLPNALENRQQMAAFRGSYVL